MRTIEEKLQESLALNRKPKRERATPMSRNRALLKHFLNHSNPDAPIVWAENIRKKG